MNITEKLFCIFCRLTPIEELALRLEDSHEEMERKNSDDWIVEAFQTADLAVSREDIDTFQEGRVN